MEKILPAVRSADGCSFKRNSVRFTLLFASRRDVEAVSFLSGFLPPLLTLHRDHGKKKKIYIDIYIYIYIDIYRGGEGGEMPAGK